jgi:hypothetical protein
LLNCLGMIVFIEIEAAKQVLKVCGTLLVREHGLENFQEFQEVTMVHHHLVYRLRGNLGLLRYERLVK